MRNGTASIDIAVVGGGLAGLAAAACAARAGASVTVLERSGHAGGRAITNDLGGFKFNLGPHAVYRAGPGARVLRELGVELKGGVPPLSGYLLRGGRLQKQSIARLLTGRPFGPRATLAIGRLLLTVQTASPASLRHLSAREWLDREARGDDVRALGEALVRVSTYANAPGRLSAEIAVLQLKLASRGVIYLHGGWQTLVDGLRHAAAAAGARIETRAAVERIERDRTVRLADGRAMPARAVIVAAGPAVAAELLDGATDAPLASWARDAVPVRAACLDVGLRRLTRPEVTFVLAIDQPYYFSVHSATAKLAPEGAAAVHVAKYLAPDDDGRAAERELDGVLDAAQPGWRDELAERRFLPDMAAVSALATAAQGGLAGRPAVDAAGVPGVYLAGDWTGSEGWLSDGSLASAKRAAALAVEQIAREGTPAPVGAGARGR